VANCLALAASAALCIFALCKCPGASALDDGKMLKISQTHFFMGKNLVFIARNAVRIQNESRLKFILVAQAPTWDVVVYRPDDKSFFKQSLASYLNSGLLSKILIGENYQDLSQPTYRQSQMQMGPVKVTRLTGKTTTAKYLPLTGVTAPQVERVLFATYQLPARGGIPIGLASAMHGTDQMTGLRTEGRTLVSLETTQIEEQKIPRGFFEAPSNYRHTKSLLEVVSGDDSRKRASEVDVLINADGR
jgi:hypothetical protein